MRMQPAFVEANGFSIFSRSISKLTTACAPVEKETGVYFQPSFHTHSDEKQTA